MSKTLLCIFTIFSNFLLFGQSPSPGKGSLSFNGGPAFSLKPFGNTDAGNSGSGFARTGPYAAFTYTTSLQKKWSFVATIQVQQHRLNTSALEKEFSNTPIASGIFVGSSPGAPLPGSAYKTYPNWQFEKKSWIAGLFLAGAQVVGGKTEKWRPYIRLQAGLLHLKLPAIKGQSVTDTASAYLDQKGASGTGLGYSSTAGIYHQLNRKIFLTAALSYTGSSRVNFSRVRASLTTTQGQPGEIPFFIQQSTVTSSASQQLSSLNLSAGIGFTW